MATLNASQIREMREGFYGEPLPTWALFVFGTLHILTSCNGVLGSFLILSTLTKTKQFHASACTYSVYMANLVVTDMWFQVYFFPSLVIGYALGRFPVVDKYHCQVMGSISLTCYAVFILTLTAISFDRYMRICHDGHHKKHFTWRTSVMICVGIWCFGLMVSLPGVVTDNFGFDFKTHVCFVSDVAPFFVSAPLVVTLLGCLIVAAFFNTRIYVVFKRVRRRVATHSEESMTQLSKKSDMGSKVAKSDMALLRSLLVLYFCLIVFVGPGSVARAVRNKYNINVVLYAFFLWLLSLNSSIDWIVYGFLNTRFRSGYRTSLAKCFPCFKERLTGAAAEVVPDDQFNKVSTGTSSTLRGAQQIITNSTEVPTAPKALDSSEESNMAATI